jgi:UDP-glucose 4-epimerase
MATAVVTGGFGFIGSHLVERLVSAGVDVTVYDPAPPPPDLACDLSAVRHVAADVRDERALGLVVTPEVDVVYHLCALVGVDQYLHDPLDVIDVNVLGTRNVLRAAHEAGAKLLVASTSEVYGRNPDPPWTEDSPRVLGSTAADRWSYSSSKAVAEHLTFAYARQHGLRAAIVRYFNVYGPRQRPAYVVSKTVHHVLNGVAPLLYDSGEQTRCFTYVDDAVEATLLAAASPEAEGECFNIGSDRETTMAEAVRTVIEVAGATTRPRVIDTAAVLGAGYEDIPRRVPDVAKAWRVLGWRSRTSLRDGLERTVEWAKANPWWLA